MDDEFVWFQSCELAVGGCGQRWRWREQPAGIYGWNQSAQCRQRVAATDGPDSAGTVPDLEYTTGPHLPGAGDDEPDDMGQIRVAAFRGRHKRFHFCWRQSGLLSY